MKLTEKQRRFVSEYIKDFNATQAALRSGYSPRTAARIGSENLQKPAIQVLIAEIQQNAQSEAVMEYREALQVLSEIARGRVSDYLNADGTFKRDAIALANPSAIQAIEVTESKIGKRKSVQITKFRLRDPQGAIERLAKMLGWDKPEKHDHTIRTLADLVKASREYESGHTGP